MRLRLCLGVFIGLLVALSLACGDSAPTSTPKVSTATAEGEAQADVVTAPLEEAAEPTSEPEPAAAPTDTPVPQLPALGEVAEKNGCTLMALALEDPAPPGTLYSPAAGTKLVAVEIEVGNISDEPIGVNPLHAALVDSEGFKHSVELAGRDHQIATLEINTGERVKGWVAFEVPEEAVPATLHFECHMFAEDTLKTALSAGPGGGGVVVAYTRPHISNLGDVVERDGYSLTAVTVEDPATPGILYTPIEGSKLIAVEIVVANISGEQISVNPLHSYLVDTSGYVYSVELGGRDGQLELVDLNAGERVKGWVAFTVPEEAQAESIKYELGVFSSQFLQAGAGEP